MEGRQYDGRDLNQNQSVNPQIGGSLISGRQYSDRRTGKEKVVSGVVLFTALVAVFLGYYVLSGKINTPVWDYLLAQNDGDGDASIGQDAVLIDLANKDTDGDGLSDYEELYVYETSPYIEDSDSDGLSDKQEIDAGKDPNCPGEDNCFRTQEPADSGAGLNYPSAGNDPLTGLNDGSAGSNPSANSGGGIDSIDDLRSLSAPQIRALLLEQITDEAERQMILQISDEDLKTMFLQQLETQLTNQ